MNPYQCIPATAAVPTPEPPSTGNWRRDEAGNLWPLDDATALSAGLMQTPAPPPSAPATGGER